MKKNITSIILIGFLSILSFSLFKNIVSLHTQRNAAYLLFQNNLEIYEVASHQADILSHKISRIQIAPEPQPNKPYLVVSLADHMLWYKQSGKVLYRAPVATGSGKALVRGGGNTAWRFDTPRGRMTVLEKVEEPVWVPPDWHYVEQSRKRGLGLAYASATHSLTLSDGSSIRVSGYDVIRTFQNGQQQVLTATAKKDLVFDGRIIVPPLGTNQRRYKEVLGPYSLQLGDGYAIHGTNQPSSIGRSVSHGCIRMYNEDITTLFRMVKVGTPVYIY